MKFRVLFVDDEEPLLLGLQNRLRRLRKRWTFSFVLGPEEALAELERSDFDAVVTDMRMPKMNGAQLLETVRDRFPTTARLVLSGHADQETRQRALEVADRYLAKPCELMELESALREAIDDRRREIA